MSDFDISVSELEKLIKDGISGRKPWGHHEDMILKKYYGKVPAKDIAKVLGRSASSVSGRVFRLGL